MILDLTNFTEPALKGITSIGLWLVCGLTLVGAIVAAAAGLASAELTRRSDLAVAEAAVTAGNANQKAGEATERAAKLELEAASLKVQLATTQRAFAGRELSVEQQETLVRMLKGKLHKVELGFRENDPESLIYAMQWMRVLLEAGVEVVERDHGGQFTNGPGLAVMMYAPGVHTQEETDADPLYRALKATDLWGGQKFDQVTERGAPPPGVHYIVIPVRAAPSLRSLHPLD